jgi:hypothetical protein
MSRHLRPIRALGPAAIVILIHLLFAVAESFNPSSISIRLVTDATGDNRHRNDRRHDVPPGIASPSASIAGSALPSLGSLLHGRSNKTRDLTRLISHCNPRFPSF